VPTRQPSEVAIVAGFVGPATVNTTPILSSAVDMSKFRRAMFILALGDMASETIDFKLQWSATSGGTYADVTGKAITQLAASASANDNAQCIINLDAADLPAGAQFVKGRAITGGATGGSACILGIGMDPTYGPASTDKSASVLQIIT
jgi:hypothetical protein